MRDLVYYVATSIDGYIADPTGDVSAFPTRPDTLAALFDLYPETCPTHMRAPLGVEAPARRFDTVLMGYATFAPALAAGFPGGTYPHLRQIVATHRALPGETSPSTVSGDLPGQIAALKQQPGQDIWLCGGADLAGQLIDLIDEIQLKINPVLLGRGIPVLRTPPAISVSLSFDRTDLTALPGNVLLTTYRRSDAVAT